MVVVLHDDEAGPAVRLLKVQRLCELPGFRRGRAEVAGLAGLHDVVKRLQRLFPRRRLIVAMDIEEVDMIDAEALEAVIHLRQDRFSRQADRIGTVAGRGAQLGGDDDRVAMDEILERPADYLLAFAVRIEIGRDRRSPCNRSPPARCRGQSNLASYIAWIPPKPHKRTCVRVRINGQVSA